MTVELRATKEIDNQVIGCDESEASAFSVYFGEPGDFELIADFAYYNDALNWAEEVANCNECELINYVEKDRSYG